MERATLSEAARFLPSMIKHGVGDVVASWAMTLGVPFRRTALEMAAAYSQSVSSPSYDGFLEWFIDLSDEQLAYEFGLRSPLLEDVTRGVYLAAPNRLLKSYAGVNQFLPRDLRVMGIGYSGREPVALMARAGQLVELVRDYGNAVDRNAISVRYAGRDLGFVERPVAQVLAPELDAGTQIRASVLRVEPGGIPTVWIRVEAPQVTA